MNKLRFLHIPKTAGSSFDECLFLQYLQDYLLRRVFTLSGNIALDGERYSRLSASKQAKIVLYVGHGPRFTGFREIDQVPTITLLRNPIDRVVSLIQHVSEGKSPHWAQQHLGDRNAPRAASSGAIDVDAFLKRGGARVSNLQSRILLGKQSYHLPPGDTESLALQAFQVLADELACFGITEEFDSSLLLFQKILEWQKPPIYRRRNSADSRAVVPLQESHMEKIRELNAVDISLYDLAKTLFQQRIASTLPNIENDLVSFRVELDRPGAAFRTIDASRAVARTARKLTSRLS